MLSTNDAWTNTAIENDKQGKEDFCACCGRGGGGRSEKSTHSNRHDSKLSVLSDDQLHQQSEIQRFENLLQSMQYTQFAEYRKTYSLLSLHEAAVFNSCSVRNRLALGYVLDHIRREFKRPGVCTAQLDDTWSQEAIFSHLETCKRVGKRWSYLKDSVQVRPGRAGQESFRKLYCKISALPLCPHQSHKGQINIPNQIAPNLLRILYKVYLALGYHAVRAVNAENVLRELTYEDIAAPTSSAASTAPLKVWKILKVPYAQPSVCVTNAFFSSLG